TLPRLRLLRLRQPGDGDGSLHGQGADGRTRRGCRLNQGGLPDVRAGQPGVLREGRLGAGGSTLLLAAAAAHALAELRLSTNDKVPPMGKKTASEETLKPDPRYGSTLASKFTNCLMWQGKKATAQRIFYGAMDQIKKRMPDLNPIEVFTQAGENVKPTGEVRPKRGGGAPDPGPSGRASRRG